MNRKKLIVIAAVLLAAIFAGVILYDAFGKKEASSEFFAMDTVISVKLEGTGGEETVNRIRNMVEELDKKVLSRHSEGSEISLLNNGSAVGGKTAEYIKTLLEISARSGGKYDPALGRVSDLWDFNGEPRVPSGKELVEALAASGADKVAVKGDKVTAAPGAVVDLGSAGKGIALDEAKLLLDGTETKRAVISVGGSILLYGDGSFSVGIRDPEGASGRSIMTLETGEACVSTSGSYERCFEENGRAYHHILDPETGYPADSGLVSVTVVSESGILSDALSTACFVLGAEDGIRLAEEYGCEAVFVTAEHRVIATGGIKDSLKITGSGYSLAE